MFSDPVPYGVNTVSVVQPLEDSVTADHDEVEVVLNLEALDVGVAHNHVGVASIPRALCLNISERF